MSKEVKPQLRFKGFNYGWIETTLGKECKCFSSGRVLNQQIVSNKGYPLYGADGLLGYVDKCDFSEDFIAIIKDGAGVGRLLYCKKNSAILGTLNAIITKDQLLKFIYYYLGTFNFTKFTVGSGIPHIYFKDYSISPIFIPTTLAEQEKIANFLTTIDKQIALLKQKLETTKTYKKGLLQRLFTTNGSKKPLLRFADFVDEWEEKKLGEVAERVTEKASGDNLQSMSISAGIGFVPQAEKFGREISGKQYEKYTKLINGIFAYNKGNSKKYPQGCVYLYDKEIPVVVPNVFICFKLDNNLADNKFFQQLFISNAHGKEVDKYINSGVRNDGLLNITVQDFFAIKFLLPPTTIEQEKIANFLTTIDKQIELLNQIIEVTQTYKKGLLQQLFPSV